MNERAVLPTSTRGVALTRYPEGELQESDFAVREFDLPEVTQGSILVQNEWFSLDPSSRIRMTAGESTYFTPFALDEVLDGWAVGRVLDSAHDDFAVGDYVHHFGGWREYAVVAVPDKDWYSPRRVEVGGGIDSRHHLGVLGPSGLTAWAGLFRVGRLKPGETVFVSAAAGAVGTLVVQMAKLMGATVVASAGTDEKVRHLVDDLGADVAFNYRVAPVLDSLQAAAPGGIDVYFDGVGGDHLDAALLQLRAGGRVALCGQIAGYNLKGDDRPGIKNLFSAIEKGLTLQGFLARMYFDEFDEFYREVAEWLARDQLIFDETIIEGIDASPAGFIGMLHGTNIGKSLVRVTPRTS
ncbi:NADP-dependent oxidoreductase [Leucobacter sp. Z1108]|uniref:NADP-dependent oxidoreductase n=1 Tax=Leucobacter sp. Z1108 TaxID=3439066 RepID=UPI003F31FD7B